MRFRCPLTIVIDQGTHFINDAFKYFTNHFIIKHTSFIVYYPQGNGQVESTNKVFGTLLTKLVYDWDEHLPQSYFHIKLLTKLEPVIPPFELVYGLHPLLST
jgi:hypothetical protein